MSTRSSHAAVVGTTLSSTRPTAKKRRRRAGKAADFLTAPQANVKHAINGTPVSTPDTPSIKKEKIKKKQTKDIFESIKLSYKRAKKRVKSFFRFMRDEFFYDPESFFLKIGHHMLVGFQKFLKWFASFSRFLLLPVTIIVIISVMGMLSAYTIGIKVSIGDQVVGYIADSQVYNDAEVAVEQSLSERIGEDYQFDETPTYSLSLVSKNAIADEEQFQQTMSVIAEERVGKSYGLFVDGILIGTYPKEDAINEMLENIKQPYYTGAQDEVVEITNDIEIVQDMYAEQYERTISEMRTALLSNSNAVEYRVVDGDTLSSIGKQYGIDTETIELLNPDVDFDDLNADTKIIVSKGEPMISVQAMRTITYEEEIEYETEISFDASLWENTEDVIVEGENGIKQYTAYIVEVDGQEVSRSVVDEVITKEPVTEKVLAGTKRIAPSGSFIWPVGGSSIISSPFGDWRSDHAHAGLDIAAAYGTEIYAVDSGTVIYAGWSNDGAGYNVSIDHGNGIITRYCHCSRLNVETGALVYQSQVIAYVGSSGNSTGPHCHFAVTIEGVYVDPALYLPSR